jgi:hypothetical protein
MKFKINEDIKKEDFLMSRKELGYCLMTPTDVKNKLGISDYSLRKLNKTMLAIRLSKKTIRYKVDEVFLTAELLKKQTKK